MRHLWYTALCALLVVVSGCSTLAGYSDQFSCPQTYNGRCVSLQGAYDLAVNGKDDAAFDPVEIEKNGGKVPPQSELTPGRTEEAAHSMYKESLFNRFTGLINEPVTPMVAPPQVMRVLLLPYKGEGNELYMLRHVYFFVDEPKWVLGDSVLALEEE